MSDSEVELEKSGKLLYCPDWVKSLIIEQVNVDSASPDGTFKGMPLTCSAAVVTDGTAFYELGDANKDKDVDILDFIRVKRYLGGSQNEILVAAGDLYGNGEVTAEDLTSLTKHLLGVNGINIDSNLWEDDIK